MRTITACTHSVWRDSTHTQILCQVTTKEAGGPFPFNVMDGDPEPHGQQLWNDLVKGKYGLIAPYVPPTPPEDRASSSGLKSVGTQKL